MIRREGLADEHELQSYFIRRIESFLLEHDRRLIGWDEILEGGLAPQATVMSWRGTSGGIEAARQGHDVIMTPNSHLYFDHYQGDPEFEPLAIGGRSTLETVYSYEPIPEELTEATVRTLRMCEEFRKLSELTGTRPCTCCFQDQPSRYPIKDHQPLCRKRRHALQLLEMATARVLLVERADRASMAGYQEEGTVPR